MHDEGDVHDLDQFGNTTQFNNIEVDPDLFPNSGKKKRKGKKKWKQKKTTEILHDPWYEEIMKEVEKTEA